MTSSGFRYSMDESFWYLKEKGGEAVKLWGEKGLRRVLYWYLVCFFRRNGV